MPPYTDQEKCVPIFSAVKQCNIWFRPYVAEKTYGIDGEAKVRYLKESSFCDVRHTVESALTRGSRKYAARHKRSNICKVDFLGREPKSGGGGSEPFDPLILCICIIYVIRRILGGELANEISLYRAPWCEFQLRMSHLVCHEGCDCGALLFVAIAQAFFFLIFLHAPLVRIGFSHRNATRVISRSPGN